MRGKQTIGVDGRGLMGENGAKKRTEDGTEPNREPKREIKMRKLVRSYANLYDGLLLFSHLS